MKLVTRTAASELRWGPDALDGRVLVLALVPIMMALEGYDRRRGLFDRIARLSIPSRYALYLALVYGTILFRGVSAQFIYFQF